jgi:hypothetical protein
MKHTATTRREGRSLRICLLTFFSMTCMVLAPAGAQAATDKAKPSAEPKGHAKAGAPGQTKKTKPSKPSKPSGGSKATGGSENGAAGNGKAHPKAKPAPSPRKRGSRSAGGGTQPATSGPVPNSGCDAHKDPRDPGSCQEKGGGNSGDIDPYRGPDSPGNDPARGNDCDEGGGNNRGTYPRKTNPNQPGDSPVDNDRGRGNNRCGVTPASSEPPGTDGVSGNTPAAALPAGALPPLVLAEALRGKTFPALATAEVLGLSESGAKPDAASNPDGPAGVTSVLGKGTLPFTGLGLGALALLGIALASGGLGLRRSSYGRA